MEHEGGGKPPFSFGVRKKIVASRADPDTSGNRPRENDLDLRANMEGDKNSDCGKLRSSVSVGREIIRVLSTGRELGSGIER